MSYMLLQFEHSSRINILFTLLIFLNWVITRLISDRCDYLITEIILLILTKISLRAQQM